MTFSLDNYLFGPLDIEYCVYFYILSIVNFVFYALIILSLIYTLIFGYKKMDSKLIGTMLFGSLAYLVLYFQNRLLHSMCVRKEGMSPMSPMMMKKSF
jgi:hypothetical protein